MHTLDLLACWTVLSFLSDYDSQHLIKGEGSSFQVLVCYCETSSRTVLLHNAILFNTVPICESGEDLVDLKSNCQLMTIVLMTRRGKKERNSISFSEFSATFYNSTYDLRTSFSATYDAVHDMNMTS